METDGMVSFTPYFLVFSPSMKKKNTGFFADYLIFYDEAGISGYLNIMTQKSEVPLSPNRK
jgi:hypothetical protein